MSDNPHYDIAELKRCLENIVRFGTIAEVDHAAHKVRVKIGDTRTDWLHQPADIGHNYVRWRPVRVGTQVVLAAAGGDLAQAAIVGMLYTQTIVPPSSNANIDVIEYQDGTAIEYDSATKELTVLTDGAVTVTAEQVEVTATGAHINAANVEINGAGGDVIVSGISLTSHTHPQNNGNDNGGDANTGVPQ